MKDNQEPFETKRWEQISLRPASEDDLEFLIRLRQRTMADHLDRIGIHLTDQEHLARIKFRFDAAKIVLYNQKAVGLLKSFRQKDTWKIVQLQIAPECQGIGIGSFLVREAMATATAYGLPVTLNVLKRNAALRFYKRLGFVVKAETEIEFIMSSLP